jgi:ATP-dependent DNA helicase RecQ
VARAVVSTPSAPAPLRETLFEELRALRKRIADERGVPPFMVFHDSTLRQMAAELPESRGQLLRIAGVGQHKALEYGDVFLARVADYLRRTRAEPVADAPIAGRGVSGDLSATVRVTLDLFKQGLTIVEIAAARKLARSTIEGHLVEAMEAGERLDLERLLDAKKRSAIAAAIAELGSTYLRPVMDHLGEGYSYAELRFVRAEIGWAAAVTE